MQRWLMPVAAAVLWAALAGWGTARAVTQVGQVVGQTSEEAAASSLAAALTLFNGTTDSSCPQVQLEMACVEPRSTPEQAARGIARFVVSESGPEAVGGFQAILGRDPTGVWRFWFGTQNISYQLFYLPGEMIVCAEGDVLNVRAGPGTDTEVLAVLPDLTPVTAEQFTLTEEGVRPTERANQVVGGGWYYVSAPVAG